MRNEMNMTSRMPQTRSREPLITVPPSETHLIRSKYVHQTFKIQIMHPARKQGDTRRFPVVYATDGNKTFEMFRAISHLLQMAEQDSPPYILVSIGYPSDSQHCDFRLRTRDLSAPPGPIVNMKLVPTVYEDELAPEEGTKDFHGGGDFLRFMKEELIPFIDEKYDTIRGDRTYYGHSGGGFIGLFTLFTDPAVFKNYIVSSPGLLFHGVAADGSKFENHECGVQMVREFVASGKSLDGIKLYMSAGADEQYEDALGPWQMVSGFYQVAKAIKNAAIPGLNFMTEVVPGETHMTMWPISFMHGVQAMFGTRRVTRSVYFDRRSE
jgi:predicted alpha/beta superfamily hydrolase